MRESSTHTSIKLCLRITIKQQFQIVEQQEYCINTNLAQCALFGTLYRKEAERNILATFCRNI